MEVIYAAKRLKMRLKSRYYNFLILIIWILHPRSCKQTWFSLIKQTSRQTKTSQNKAPPPKKNLAKIQNTEA